MKKIPAFFLLFIVFKTVSVCAQEGNVFESKFAVEQLSTAPAMLIPFPQQLSWDNEFLEMSEWDVRQAEIWPEPLAGELMNIAGFYGIKTGRERGLSVKFKSNNDLAPEAYRLSVSKKGIHLEAATEAGHFYALQTLRQLIQKKDGRCFTPLCEIEDWPAYPARGYMLDVGRNFQSMASLKQQIDIMAMYKMNVFHWHLTDRPAWRIESKWYPQLTAAANHRPTRDPGKFYSYDDIRELIAYARKKHISIIPEIDMPGHSDSFVKSMGVKMESEKGMEMLENILNEFFSEIPQEDCPIVHIGSDEVHIDNPEEFIARMVGVCKKNNRDVIIWNPGLNADSTVVRQTWQTKHLEKGAFKEIDSWNNYINNGEPMTQVLRLFFKPIGYPSDNEVIGGILCFWPDVNLEQEADAFRQNPVYPSLLTYAWKTWTADVSKAPTAFYTLLPAKGTPAFEYFSVFEKILFHHKNKFFTALPFPYFPQSDKEWKLIGPFRENEGDQLLSRLRDTYTYLSREISWKNAGGNTLVIKDRFKLGGYYPEAEAGQTVYALTYIHSDIARTVDTWIGFETPLRANRVYTGIPVQGSWDVSGGGVWVNDEPLPAPHWENPGWRPSKSEGWGAPQDQETPWAKEELYWTRTPSKVPLKKGWNKVFVKIPCSSSYQNWMFTFVPLEMEGLQFSTSPLEHSTYYYQKKTHFEQLPNSRKEIIFIGDSITDGCEWSEMFGNKKIKNRGISGDITQGVLDRLEETTDSKPKKVFLMIGINDLARGLTAEYVLTNTRLIVGRIREASPKTQIFLQSLLPVNDYFGKFDGHTDKNEAVKTVNLGLQKMAGENVIFINLHEKFLNGEGKLNLDYTNDGLHLNGNGYRLWKELIEGFVK
ncbi:MAG: family 20 glycosylhydrolase [Lewinellaceae bacterium]|nr:family 20 glycosylhydrolase [Lewinellaceae bacterium]